MKNEKLERECKVPVSAEIVKREGMYGQLLRKKGWEATEEKENNKQGESHSTTGKVALVS